jgi:hypothetical protein
MKNLSTIAIKAFNQGSDNFGETPTGEVTSLRKTVYKEGTIFIDTNYVGWDHYSCTVMLVQPDGHHCTSGIGFYVKDNVMDICSGHIVFSVPVTNKIQEELNQAEISLF